MLLKPKNHIIYGPVNSRRLGRSLGINLLPVSRKTCTFNCLYCHYGWSDPVGPETTRRSVFPSEETIYAAVESTLNNSQAKPDFITFSGNGEPTLHPRFSRIVTGILELRNRLSPDSKTAILSNSSCLEEPGTIRALQYLDMAIMKLDAGNQKMFSRYNQPAPGITLETIITGLTALKNLTIQTLISGGLKGNDHPSHIRDWRTQLKRISPKNIQLYTLDRPAPCGEIHPVPKTRLRAIQNKLKEDGLSAMVF